MYIGLQIAMQHCPGKIEVACNGCAVEFYEFTGYKSL
jgi:hypothetical protein